MAREGVRDGMGRRSRQDGFSLSLSLLFKSANH